MTTPPLSGTLEVMTTSQRASAPLRLRLLDPDDAGDLQATVDVLAAAFAVDAPWRRPPTVRGIRQEHVYGFDGDPEPFYLAHRGGDLVAVGALVLPSRDNLDHAWVFAIVHPSARREGIGTWVYDTLEGHAVDAGRSVLGTFGRDLPHVHAFAVGRGYVARSRSVARRLTFADLPPGTADAVFTQALPYAADYELLRVTGPLPEDLMAGYVHAVAAINDAPTDDLDVEDELVDAERVRSFERSRAERGETLYRVIARHRATGDIAGHTVVTIDPDRPQFGDQYDTSVVHAHRGHRLGLLLKADMMRWLAEAVPACAELTASNAESNTHMIAVNEALGYRALGTGVAYQRTLTSAAD